MPSLQLGKDGSERYWHRTAAGVRGPRANACPAERYSDAQLAMQIPPRKDALAPVQAAVRDHTHASPQGTGARGCRAAQSCEFPGANGGRYCTLLGFSRMLPKLPAERLQTPKRPSRLAPQWHCFRP